MIFLPPAMYMREDDDEPEKVKCPKCKHEFEIPEEECGSAGLWGGLWLMGVLVGFFWGGLSLLDIVPSPEQLLGDGSPYSMAGDNRVMGIYLIFTVVCILGGAISLALEK